MINAQEQYHYSPNNKNDTSADTKIPHFYYKIIVVEKTQQFGIKDGSLLISKLGNWEKNNGLN